MGRKSLIQKSIRQSSQLLPFPLLTLYDEQANKLADPCSPVLLVRRNQHLMNKLHRMKLTAASIGSVVLAGSQVGLAERVFVLHERANEVGQWTHEAYAQPDHYRCYVNGRIVAASNPVTVFEESLSFPFINIRAHRYSQLEVQYLDERGEPGRQQLQSQQAYAFQQAYDYALGQNILNWRLHHGDITLHEDVREKLPKTLSVLEQYRAEVEKVLTRFPELRTVPGQLREDEVGWLEGRGSGDPISIEEDFYMRIYRHYRKEMVLLLERVQLNLYD